MTNEFSKFSLFLVYHMIILCIENSSFLTCNMKIFTISFMIFDIVKNVEKKPT